MKTTLLKFLLVLNGVFCFFTLAFSQGWEWQNPLPQGNIVRSLDAVDANQAWFGTSAGVIVYTPDGGQSWQLQQTPSLAWIEGIDFINAEYGWAVGEEPVDPSGQDPVILHTKDGGNNWSLEPWPPGLSRHHSLKAVKFYDRQKGWIIGTQGLILFTDDGGKSWENQSDNVLPNRVGILEDISIVDSSLVWVVGHRAILLTQDAGQIWESDTTDFIGTNVFETVQFVDKDHVWLLEFRIHPESVFRKNTWLILAPCGPKTCCQFFPPFVVL